jgi:hypothetical protein
MFLDDKLAQCMLKLKKQEHKVRPRTKYGELCFEIDGRILASSTELEYLAAGVYTVRELEEFYEKRRAEENETR